MGEAAAANLNPNGSSPTVALLAGRPVKGDTKRCEFCGLAFRPPPDRPGQRFGCNCCGSEKPHRSDCPGHDPFPAPREHANAATP